jgi:chromosome segregation ATPase
MMSDHPYDEQAKYYEQRECALQERIDDLDAWYLEAIADAERYRVQCVVYEGRIEELEARRETNRKIIESQRIAYRQLEAELREAHHWGYMAGVGDSEDYDHNPAVMEKEAWADYLAEKDE